MKWEENVRKEKFVGKRGAKRTPAASADEHETENEDKERNVIFLALDFVPMINIYRAKEKQKKKNEMFTNMNLSTLFSSSSTCKLHFFLHQKFSLAQKSSLIFSISRFVICNHR